MPFSSVRLTHAQGTPQNYITNQVYIPTDEDHRNRGCFLILCEHSAELPKTLVTTLTNTLIREYYRQTGDTITSFEQTLIRLNDQLRQQLNVHDRDAASSLNGTVVLITDNEIHLTHVGAPLAFLVRQKTPLPLSETGNPHTKFSMITSGEVKKGDLLVLMTGEEYETLTHDLKFAATQEPFVESGRALARLLKQHGDTNREGMCVTFDTDEDLHTHIALDKPLESPTETIAGVNKKLKQHADFVVSGVHFLAESAITFAKKKSAQAPAYATASTAAATNDVEEPTYEEFIADEDENSTPITAEAFEETKHITPPESAYKVKHYWESGDTDTEPEPLVKKAKREEPKTAPVHTISYEDDDETELPPLGYGDESDTFTKPKRHISFSFPRLSLTRTNLVYAAIAVVLVVIVVVRVGSAVVNRVDGPSQDVSQRDALISQAQAATRDAEAAQLQDDTSTAIKHLLAGQAALKKIKEDNLTEQGKALTKEISTKLASLSKTTALSKTASEQQLPDNATQVIVTSQGNYVVLANNTILKTAGDKIIPLDTPPSGSTIITATPYDSGKKIALLTKQEQALKLYSIATDTDVVTEITRSDNKAWPAATLMSNFDKNLYLVGSSMFKALPASESAYRVIAYAATTPTEDVTSITINSGIFYAFENGVDLIRIAANAPKTTIKPFGVPGEFLPAKYDQLLTSTTDGQLLAFDKTGQRIVVLSTDGAYRKQYTLPSGKTFTTCDATVQNFVCATDDKKVVTIPIGQ